MNSTTLFTPIQLPFSLPMPLPSIAAYFTVNFIMLTFWCWGCWLSPKRWPFRLLPVRVPLNSSWWYICIAYTTLSRVGCVLRIHAADLGIAAAWIIGLSSVVLSVRFARHLCHRRTTPLQKEH